LSLKKKKIVFDDNVKVIVKYLNIIKNGYHESYLSVLELDIFSTQENILLSTF